MSVKVFQNNNILRDCLPICQCYSSSLNIFMCRDRTQAAVSTVTVTRLTRPSTLTSSLWRLAVPLQHRAATTSFSGKRTHRMKLVDLSIWIEKQDGFALWCSLMNTGGGVVRKHF